MPRHQLGTCPAAVRERHAGERLAGGGLAAAAAPRRSCCSRLTPEARPPPASSLDPSHARKGAATLSERERALSPRLERCAILKLDRFGAPEARFIGKSPHTCTHTDPAPTAATLCACKRLLANRPRARYGRRPAALWPWLGCLHRPGVRAGHHAALDGPAGPAVVSERPATRLSRQLCALARPEHAGAGGLREEVGRLSGFGGSSTRRRRSLHASRAAPALRPSPLPPACLRQD